MERFLPAGVVAVTLALTVVLGLISGSLAIAQDEKPKKETAQSEKATEEYKLETMTVTSQKREENVQDVPMSISVFSGIELEDAGIENTADLTRFIPNLYMKHFFPENVIVIRGITSFDTSLYAPAGFYVDDVSLPLHYMHDPEFFDIERIEVLKGPQGTLYGKNSESGVINIITKQPDNELRGKVFGEYGNYDTSHGNSPFYKAGGSISGPLVRDRLYMGLAGQWKDSDGYIKNIYNNDDEVGKIDRINGRGILRWTPADRWDISIIADIMDTDDGKGYFKYFSGPFKTDRHEVALDGEYYFETKGNGQTLRIKYEGNAFNVLSVTGRRYYKAKHGGDIDATPLDFGSYFKTDKNDFLSEELRVSSPNKSGPFQWLIGVYGFKEETDVDFPFAAETRYTDMDTDGYAGFGQCIYTLFDRLHLTAGLRYEHLDLKGKQKYEFIDVMGTPQSLTYGKDRDFDEVLPKFSITFDFTDDIMAYASASKGYLAGGYDYAMSTGLENFAYGPEYTWNYEIGTKTSWLDKRLMLNLSLFYIDMEDKQVMEWLPGTMATKIENAAEAHSMGVELELKVRPTQGLDLFAGFGYMEAEFDDWTTTELNMTTFQFEEYDYKDKDLPNAPRYTYNLGVQYRHLSGFFGRVDLLGTGSFYGDAKNDSKIDAYQLVNLRLGYEKEKFDIVLWSKNLFDEDYDVMRVRYGTDELGMDGEPRMFGATVTYRF